jgi:hypothetical protein
MAASKRKPRLPIFEPPPSSWDFGDFLNAGAADIVSRTVDCSTCPVALLCHGGAASTGTYCQACGATAVYWEGNRLSDAADRHVLVIDCHEHRFSDRSNSQHQCALCDGEVIRDHVKRQKGKVRTIAVMHYLHTTHASYSAASRQEAWKEEHKKCLQHEEQLERVKAERQKQAQQKK